MYKYSVIIPVYNAEKSISRAIDCIVNQTYENWELVLVNDGSTDNSQKILEKYANMDSRIVVLNQENVGPGFSRNNGIQVASGDYVAFLDADDYYDADYLECVEKINVQEKKDVVFVDFINEDSQGNSYGQSTIYSYRNYSKHNLMCMQMTGVMPWGPCVKVVSKTIIKKCSFSELKVGEEAVYSFDVLNKSKKIGFVKTPKYHYVHNQNGQHTQGGINPWGPVVDAIKFHTIKTGCYKEFESTINAFALRALCINVYRCACNFKVGKAINQISEAYSEYFDTYDLNNLNRHALDRKSMIILWFLRMHMHWLVYIASKIRKCYEYIR